MPSVILVTGASSGLGRATTERLARAGHIVWAGYRDPEGRNATASAELRALANAEDLQLRVVDLDVTSDASVNAAVARVLATDGRVDVLLNNAGRMYIGLAETFSAAQLTEQLDTNVVGAFRVVKAVLPSMRANQSGLLLHTSSVFGRVTNPFTGMYNASKFALEGLMSVVAYETHLLGIDSVLLEPGPFRTAVGAKGDMPADAHLTPEYGPVAGALQAWGEGYGAFMAQAIPDLEPAVFADAVLALVEAAPGTRPLRLPIGLKYGVDTLNELATPFERGMLEGQQLGFLIGPRAS